LQLSGENTGLDRGTHGDCFVRILSDVREPLENLCHKLSNNRHPRNATDKNHFIELPRVKLGVIK
jgi:NAD-specific glutamate dehydrogenase